jgi:hypothetical protein
VSDTDRCSRKRRRKDEGGVEGLGHLEQHDPGAREVGQVLEQRQARPRVVHQGVPRPRDHLHTCVFEGVLCVQSGKEEEEEVEEEM